MEHAAAAMAWPARRDPPRRRARASAVVPGEPASRAMPSLGRSSWRGTPRSAKASAASRVPPPGARTRPTPTRIWNACASGITSPAHPTDSRGTAGTRSVPRSCARSSRCPASTRARAASPTTTGRRSKAISSISSRPRGSPMTAPGRTSGLLGVDVDRRAHLGPAQPPLGPARRGGRAKRDP